MNIYSFKEILSLSHFLIKKASLKGEITVPPSKSHTLRAILFGTLGKGKTLIHNYLNSPDTHAMVTACRLFGAKIAVFKNSIEIQGKNGQIEFSEDVIYAGNSGIVLRFCSAVGALCPHPVVITGDDSIRYQRPMQPLLNSLSELNVKVSSMRGDGYAPVIIQGPLKSGKTTIFGEDSQPVSALLIAAAFANGPIDVKVQNPGEKPWITLTLNWFDLLGISYQQTSFEHFHLPGKTRFEGFEYTVPGDLSSAAFPLAAALVTESELTIKNIDMRDSQGDKELIYHFQEMGACLEIDEKKKSLHVKKGKKLSGISIDINNCIDAVTILAVVACFANGETHIQNAANAKYKECNRLLSIVKELQKMGANILATEDGLRIRGAPLKGSKLFSYNDHRMAMSLAVAGLGSSGITEISSIECVSKTFPNFLTEFNSLGAGIKMIQSRLENGE